ncbi:FixH family protein [Draconibacterium sp.]|jgi:hypothetical protein
MKYNWGTGILLFLILFLAVCAVFITFAMRQNINLVHKDYYEKGVDYTEQMNVNARSLPFKNDFIVTNENDFLVVNIAESLSAKIDSGKVLMFRPSDSKQDILYDLKAKSNTISLPKENLASGRYILKVYWYSNGLKYEIDQAVNVE